MQMPNGPDTRENKMEQGGVNHSYHLFNFYCIPGTGIY